MAEHRAVATIGSVHMDLIAAAGELPGAGESVTGSQFTMAPGGKAGNQAVQLARCGLASFVVTRLGDDLFGRELLAFLQGQGVRTNFVVVDRERATGASTIFAAHGDYSSIIVPGAAAALADADVAAISALQDTLAAVVLQLELPLPPSLRAAQLARELGGMVVLNASPMPVAHDPELEKLIRLCNLLIVNRVEAARLTTRQAGEPGWRLARAIQASYPLEHAVVTLGRDGAAYAGAAGEWVQPAFPAVVRDAVGAGDAFLGAFVATLITGETVPRALRRGAAAGAITIARTGGGAALPSGREIDDYLLGHEGVASARRGHDG